MSNGTTGKATDPRALERARALARTLDTAVGIPGTRFRVGLDPILGLIPGVGDLAGVLLSTSILLTAARLGVPSSILVRMGVNIGLEGIIGTIPVLGDLFDAGWRANTRNVRLIEAHLADPARSARAGSRWLLLTALGLGAALLALVVGAVWVIITVARLVGIG